MNKKIRIGIIGGGSGDVLAATACNMNLKTILVAGKETDRGVDIADESYVIDYKNKEEIVELLLEKVDCTVIGTGHKYAHEIAKELYDKGMPISIEPYKAEYGKNKLKTYEMLKSLGYKAPDYIIVEYGTQITKNLLENITLPCVVKSIEDAVGTAKANNIEQLRSILEENMNNKSSAIVQEFIDGLDVTIPVISDGTKIEAVKRALDLKDLNRIAIIDLANFENTEFEFERFEVINEEVKDHIIKLVEDVVVKIGLVGVPRFDIKVTRDREIYVLEINEVAVSRFGPGHPFGGYIHFPWEKINFNMAEEMIKVALQQMNIKNSY